MINGLFNSPMMYTKFIFESVLHGIVLCTLEYPRTLYRVGLELPHTTAMSKRMV